MTNTAILSDDEINDLCGVIGANTTMRAENDRKLVRGTVDAVIERLGASDAVPIAFIEHLNPDECDLVFYKDDEFDGVYEYQPLYNATALAQATERGRQQGREEMADYDVRNIMLKILPGMDGAGQEVFAKSIQEIEAELSMLSEQLEEWQLGIRRHSEMVAAIAQARQQGREEARAELEPLIDRLRASLKKGTSHSHHCLDCVTEYTPDRGESEDCPNGCDGAARQPTQKEPT